MVSDELRQAVKSYQMNESATQILRGSNLVLFAGISGAGKNAIIQQLLTTGKFHFVVSHTTRPPRENKGVMEQNGREYWFVSEEEMVNKLRRGEMLEAKLIYGRQVSGSSIEELERAAREGRVPVNEVDIQGVEELRQHKPDLLSFFLLPPSFEEWRTRLYARGSMNDQELVSRLQTATHEIRHCLESDNYTFVINDDLVETREYILQILDGRLDADMRKEKSQEKARVLLDDLQRHLSSL